MERVNVTQLIDDRPISRFQIQVFFLCALVVFLDGIDYQVIGIAAPLISKDLGIERSSLAWVFSAGTLGAAAGALVCGLVADRLGRQRTLVVTTLLFGLTTLVTAFAESLASLVTLRFITGLGLGGAVPCFIALTSEYAPQRRRATIVSMLWAAFPLGGMTGGFINAYIIRNYDWHHLFYLWGFAPVLVAIALAFRLPESVRFLLTRDVKGRRIRDIVEKIQGAPTAPTATFIATDERLPGLPLRHLFSAGRAKGTLPLWLVLFIVLGALTVLSTWTPALITPLGFTASDAALIVAFNGFGSFIGTSSAGRLIERFGVARCVIPAFTLSAIAVTFFGTAGGGSFPGLVLASFLAGLFLGLSSSSGIALSALVYPTAVRSTGIGWALGIGRLGSVFGPLAIGLMVGLNASVFQIFIAVALCLLAVVPCVWFLARYNLALAQTIAAIPEPESLLAGTQGYTDLNPSATKQ